MRVMSIRTYIFGLLTSLILVIAIVFSFQSAQLFLGSFQFAVEGFMIDVGEHYPEDGQQEQDILGNHATFDWNLVPDKIKLHYPRIPDNRNTLNSKFVDWTYIAPPENVYGLVVVEREDGRLVYVSVVKESGLADGEKEESPFFIDPMVVIILAGISGLLIFVLVLLYIFKKIAEPVEALQTWARNMSLYDLNEEHPDFKFLELNGLAKLIQDNSQSLTKLVEREQDFLRYASHELRTPIAVIRSNSALLEKINDKPSEQEQLIRDRIQRASFTMKSITETLLWLSREEEPEMPIEQVCLGDLIVNTKSELFYLLTGKPVEVTISADESIQEISKTPAMIVLSNLIRNAFQHTQHGYVEIVQQGDRVSVLNRELGDSGPANGSEELGFGLGMRLVEKLTTQFNWPYTIDHESGHYKVSIQFSPE